MEKKPQISNKGLYTDSNEEFQPEGTYRFLLNGILDGYEGDKGSVTNEMGNEFCFKLPDEYDNDDFEIIGACLLPDNRVVLFLTDDMRSMIGIQNPNCTFDIIIAPPTLLNIANECLNFKKSNLIDCIFKLHNGCDYYIYFTDSLNKYKSINLNNLDQYKYPTDPTRFNCGLMNITPDFGIPDIYLRRILTTGSLKIGAYQFTIRYLDGNLNVTNWTNLSNPVYITLPDENQVNHDLNNGGFLGTPDQDGFFYSNKAIELLLDNLDISYPYYQIGIIESAGEFEPITGAYISGSFTIPAAGTGTFVLNDVLPSSNILSVDPSELTVPLVTINVAKAHTQLENRLILGNLEDPVRDWAAFQRAANEIQTEYFVYDGDTIDSCTQYNIGFDNDEQLVSNNTFGNNFANVTVNKFQAGLDGIFIADTTGGPFDGFFNFVSVPIVSNPYNLNSNYYTIPSDGFYQAEYIVEATIQDNIMLPVDYWSFFAAIEVNGVSSPNTGGGNAFNINGSQVFRKISNILYLNAGDTISLYFNSNNPSGNINFDVTFSITGSLQKNTSDIDKDYSFPLVSYDNKTYMRDEVYALGIVFMFKDGSESPVFHIPGRPKIGTSGNLNDYAVTTYTVDGTNYTSALGYNYWTTLNSGVSNQNGDIYNVWSPDYGTYTGIDWDTYIYNLGGVENFHYRVLDNTSQYPTTVDQERNYIANCEILNSYRDCQTETIERWRHVNTSIAGEIDPVINSSDLCKHEYNVREVGLMGYYDTGTLYPDTKDCNGVPIYPSNPIYDNDENIIGYNMQYIRHHMMPDARKVNIFESVESSSLFDRGCNSVFTLLPIGIKYSNVNTAISNHISQDIQDQIQSFYFVRGDRAGNKTVIDKGWMNVTDVTWGWFHNEDGDPVGPSGELYDDYKQLQVNRWYLTPDQKVGMISQPFPDDKYIKRPELAGWNIVEFFSPKSSFNEIVNLGGDYYKVENTLYGGFSVYDNLAGNSYVDSTSNNQWKLCTYGLFDKSVIPHMYHFGNRNNGRAVYKLPIQGSEYAMYNQNTNSTIIPNFRIKNDLYRQTMMISKLFYNNPTDSSCGCQKPKQTALYPLADARILAGVEDIIPWNDVINSPGAGAPPGYAEVVTSNITPYKWIDEGDNASFGQIGRQFEDPDNFLKDCRRKWSPFAYYAALKNDIRPYQKLENIKYIKTTNYIIEADGSDNGDTCFQNNERMFIGGGDCFIARQQQVKTFFHEKTTTSASQAHNFGGSMLWGYVESEINAHYRHKEQGDDYYAYPWDTVHQTIYEITQQLRPTATRTTAQQFYHYRLSYSKDNNDRYYFPLSDAYQFCTDCSNIYPYTIIYSDPSLSEDIPDKYRIFRTANNQSIPGDTGEITNLIIKEQQLFAFTLNNLWRFNVSPQQLKTDIDTIQIGQGGFLAIKPVKVFDNKQGSPRGGCEFKFSSSYGDDSFIWVDNLSGRIYEMSQGIKEISLAGMKRYFKNNLNLKFRDQFKLVTISPVSPNGLDYTIFSTVDGMGVGYKGNYDPQYNRYILHKRDFTILPEALDQNGLIRYVQFLVPPVADNLLYFNGFNNKLYKSNLPAIPVDGYFTEITSFEEYPQFFKNESFTISYSIQDKVWVSFHSYLPSFMYYDFNTFYTTYSNNIDLQSISWKHNVHNYTTYCEEKFNFIIDYVQSSGSVYQEKVFDTVEYVSNTFEWDPITQNYKEIQFTTFNQMYVYNNNQISNLKQLIVSNLNPYQHIQFDINKSYVNKDRNYWRVKKFRDMAINRLTSPESLFSTDWTNTDYADYFSIPGVGYIDKIINPNIIDLNKNGYSQQRFTDKYLGIRLFFNPEDEQGNPLNYKINFNMTSDLIRKKL